MRAAIEVHALKQLYPILAIEDGMQIDCRDEQYRKTARQIFRSFDGDSNVTVDMDLHRLKHLSPIFSTEDGIQIDCRDEKFWKFPGERIRR
jgi:hypothetical protein